MKEMFPYICIYYYNYSDIISFICYGIEEEGLFFKIKKRNDIIDLNKLAYKAACDSSLGIGIGIISLSVVLNLDKLNIDKPIFCLKECSIYFAKILGINAARIAKKVSLKPIKINNLSL